MTMVWKYPMFFLALRFASALGGSRTQYDNIWSATQQGALLRVEGDDDERRAQATVSCDTERSAFESCASVDCESCIDDAYNAFLAAPRPACFLFEFEMCNAIFNVCTSCSACQQQVDAFYECEFDRQGCGVGMWDCDSVSYACGDGIRDFAACSLECATCISDGAVALFEGADEIACTDYEAGMCTIFDSGCPECSTCGSAPEDYYFCVTTCPFLDCAAVPPPSTPNPGPAPTPKPTPLPTRPPTSPSTRRPTMSPTTEPTADPTAEPTSMTVDESTSKPVASPSSPQPGGGSNEGDGGSRGDVSGTEQNPTPQEDDNNILTVVAGAAVGALVAVALVATVLCYCSRRTGSNNNIAKADEVTVPPDSPYKSSPVVPNHPQQQPAAWGLPAAPDLEVYSNHKKNDMNDERNQATYFVDM